VVAAAAAEEPKESAVDNEVQKATPLAEYTGWDGVSEDSSAIPSSFCLIESRETVKDFAEMNLEEIINNMEGRRTRIFLLMEEVRRLKIQQRLKEGGVGVAESMEETYNNKYPSALPLLPPMTDETLDKYNALYFFSISAILLFGGIIAPALEVKLGLGGQSYSDLIRFLHLPQQLSQVDPFVASFTGGAVGVISSLMLIETNNVKQQSQKRCGYCNGSGYLACAICSGVGIVDPNKMTACKCTPCSGTGKVMCTSCLCTGMMLATEHDPRIDPFD